MLEVIFVFMIDKTVAVTYGKSGPGLNVNCGSREFAKISDLSIEENTRPWGVSKGWLAGHLFNRLRLILYIVFTVSLIESRYLSHASCLCVKRISLMNDILELSARLRMGSLLACHARRRLFFSRMSVIMWLDSFGLFLYLGLYTLRSMDVCNCFR